MINKLVPNQKAIRIQKALSDKNHLYTITNKNALSEALKILKPNTFKIWMWLNSNQDDYEFGLSGTLVQEECGMSKATYDKAIKELIETGYLVPTELYKGLHGYVFKENRKALDKNYPTDGQNLSNELDKNYPTDRQNLSSELDKNYPRNIIYNTNNNIERLKSSLPSDFPIKELLEKSWTEEQLTYAFNSKKEKEWNTHGYGLFYTENFKTQIQKELIKQKQEEKELKETIKENNKLLEKQLNNEKIVIHRGTPAQGKKAKLIDLNSL